MRWWQLVLSEQTRADIIMGNDHAGAESALPPV